MRRTSRHIRQQIYTMLGYANQPALATNLQVILNSFIRQSQVDIYWQHGFEDTRILSNISTVAGTALYTLPAGLDPKRRIAVDALYQGIWVPLAGPGIEWNHDTYADNGDFPVVYDMHDQLEIWPTPQSIFTIRIEYFNRLEYFLEPDDWAVSTVHALGDMVKSLNPKNYPEQRPFDTATADDFLFECTTAGTSHASVEPTWPTVSGNTVSDGTVTWTARLNTASVPDDLILNLSLYKAKLHYRQPDAETYFNSFNAMLNKMKGDDKQGRQYVRPVGYKKRIVSRELPWIPPVMIV